MQVVLRAPTYVVLSDCYARRFSFDVMREQAICGAVAIVAGAFIYMTSADENGPSVENGPIVTTVQDSRIAVYRSSFTNCNAVSFTGKPSLGPTSVYGGAVSLLHSPQVSLFTATVFHRLL